MYMEQLEVVHNHKEGFVYKLRESLYGLNVPKKWYKMLDSLANINQEITITIVFMVHLLS
jgi:hypothetical protein